MKKTFLFAGMAAALLGCNSHSDHTAGKPAHDHHENKTEEKDKNDMNPIKATMDKMMHEMHGSKPTGNNDIDFASMMIEHHKGAVEMSKVLLGQGSNTELKKFAQEVIRDQEKEISLMQDIISGSAKTPSSNTAEFQKALSHSMMSMMNDSTVIYNDIDRDYAAQMIPHHQSAVDMARAYLEHGSNTDLATLSHRIVAAQTKEIDWLREWLNRNKE